MRRLSWLLEHRLGKYLRRSPVQVRPGAAPEVAFAAPPRPLSEDRQRQDLAPAQEGGTAGTTCGRGVVVLPPVDYVDVQ
jgi:hypothetical protein